MDGGLAYGMVCLMSLRMSNAMQCDAWTRLHAHALKLGTV